jgi:hypothetical protein
MRIRPLSAYSFSFLNSIRRGPRRVAAIIGARMVSEKIEQKEEDALFQN